MRLGAHVSAAGGVEQAPLRAAELGLQTFQYFSRPPQGGPAPRLSRSTLAAFARNCREHGLETHYIHSPYVINLSSANDRTRLNSVAIIRQELKRASLLKSRGVVAHLGSAPDQGSKELIRRLTTTLQQILEGYRGAPLLLLENCAGAGRTVGRRFEEIAAVLERLADRRVGVCLDTAHAFAAGYDLRSAAGVARTLANFDRTIGLDRLMVVHFNDSAAGLGERRDRHAHIGKGLIGAAGIRALAAAVPLRRLDLLLETPLDGRKRDVRLMRQLLAGMPPAKPIR